MYHYFLVKAHAVTGTQVPEARTYRNYSVIKLISAFKTNCNYSNNLHVIQSYLLNIVDSAVFLVGIALIFLYESKNPHLFCIKAHP